MVDKYSLPGTKDKNKRSYKITPKYAFMVMHIDEFTITKLHVQFKNGE
jgi:hypothetical protein